MIIIMLGAPGSGKGTVSKLLAQTTGVLHIATGDMFREEVANKTPLGEEAQNYMSKGLLVPDDVTIKMIEERLLRPEAQNGVVFDGFPRNKAQAQALKNMITKQGKQIDLALQLNIPDEDIIYRTVKRRICSNKECGAIYNLEFKKPKVEGVCDSCGSPLMQRVDDNEATIQKRLDGYHEKSKEIVEYFEQERLIYPVQIRATDDITKEIVNKWLEDFATVKQ